MKHEQEFDSLCWYLVHTNPRQEGRANSNLQAWGVETFAPLIKEQQVNKYTGAVTYVVKPLFPSYIFARFRLNELFHKVRFTRGVHSVVSFGDLPNPVDDCIVDLVKTRMKGSGFVRLNEELKPGDEVTVIHGPLRSLAAIFQRELKGSDRVVILLKAVKYQARVEISRDVLKKV